jgi:nucleoside-diphosphate-sugar epimerase
MASTVLITGAAGYIGSMVVVALSKLETVGKIVGIDLRDGPALCAARDNFRFVKADISEDAWVETIRDEEIDVVVHCAYQIRQLYGSKREVQRRWNVDGARKVFEFALRTPSVSRLIQLSTVSAYGANATNSLDHSLTEGAPLGENEYLYGSQKREIEALLQDMYERYRPSTHVLVLRLASVSGPRGRFGLNRYGLVSTVAGKFPFLICGRSDWGRQYLHEDDIVAVIGMLTQLPAGSGIDVFNVSPKDYLSVRDLGRLFKKRVLLMPPILLRPLFWLLWHGTRGVVTTPPGAWRFLSYPIRVDGSRLKAVHGYECRYSSLEALMAETGTYAKGPPLPPHDESGPVAAA